MSNPIRLRGDLHSHTKWSDGSRSIAEMAMAAHELGHEYLAITDHSPRAVVANGLSRERLLAQWEEIAEVQRGVEIRILRGIEVDILASGALDQANDLLDGLDIVVASVHTDLHAESKTMTRRMVAAIANPQTMVLGHCTGRRQRADGTRRPPSRFDADVVFSACVKFGVAVEINSRPDRADPPDELLRLAAEHGCLFSIDSDAHDRDQLANLELGIERATRHGIDASRVINTWPVEDLIAHRWRAR